MTGRPLYKALWPVLRRDSSSVQFGSDPSHATVVAGLRADEAEALQQLDGTRDLPAALRTPHGRDLLGQLIDHRLVLDASSSPSPRQPPQVRALLAHDEQASLRTAPTPSHGYAAAALRQAAHLLVVGRGELPRAVADQLRRAGVGSVRQGAEAADDREPAELVVVVARGAVDSATGLPWRARGIPVLPVVLHGVEAVVGPVVEPGGPCLRCLDLARADLDPPGPPCSGSWCRSSSAPGPRSVARPR